jgi:microcin C transport system ATP-binding protein
MIFQEPMTALNPLFTVGDQVAEVLQVKQGLSGRQAWDGAVEALAPPASRSRHGVPGPSRTSSRAASASAP